MDFSSHLLAISVAVALLFLCHRLFKSRNQNQKKKIPEGQTPPEPPGAWPIIGHLHLLGSHKTLARTWAAMADRHGPIFSVLLGGHRAFVVNSSDLIRECLTKNDRVLAARPKSSHGEYFSYNYSAFGFASYGPCWRETRKLTVVQLLSTQRLKSQRQVLVSEVDSLVQDLYLLSCQDGNVVNISEMLERFSINIITRMIGGKRYFSSGEHEEKGERIEKLMKDFMYVSGVFVPSDLIPFLGWMDYFPGPLRTIREMARELDSLLEGWITEHKSKRTEGESGLEMEEDFIDVMLSVMDDHMFGHTREDIIKGTALTLLMAGADTAAISLIWIISNLLNNRSAMEAAHQELDLKIGKDRTVQDIDNLTYIQAIVKETLRLYPPGPVAVPHEAMEDCSIGGYHVPRGTRVFMNLWKLHRDPDTWKDPDQFVPERFVTDKADVDLWGKQFELIPFGSGRRSCPGMALALQVLHLAIARLLQGFKFETPDGECVDMNEGLGITLPKVKPLEVRIRPRLSPSLYKC